jgi:hypothetical protein
VSGAWIDAELLALIELYDRMHQCAMSGEAYNKAQMIRDSRCFDGSHQPLIGRSKGSIEMKLMNVSAAVEALGRPDLSMAEYGYRPMKNMQKALKDAVEVWLAFEPHRQPADHGHGNAYVVEADDPTQQRRA